MVYLNLFRIVVVHGNTEDKDQEQEQEEEEAHELVEHYFLTCRSSCWFSLECMPERWAN